MDLKDVDAPTLQEFGFTKVEALILVETIQNWNDRTDACVETNNNE